MKSPEQVKKRLWAAAELAATRRGFAFGKDCEGHVRSFIDAGVANLAQAAALDDEIRLMLAEAGITALVEKMVEEAVAKHLPELRESTFWAARNLLCPLWPFC